MLQLPTLVQNQLHTHTKIPEQESNLYLNRFQYLFFVLRLVYVNQSVLETAR